MIRYNYLPNLQEQFSFEDENQNEVRFWINKETGDFHIKMDDQEKIIPFEIGIRIVDLLATKQENFKESKKANWYRKLI